jgi:radical SAM-linked protein
MPKISFDDPLPVGLESLKECFRLTVAETVSPESLMSELNKQLPEGLAILDCQPVLEKNARSVPESVRYRITLKDRAFDKAAVERFISSPEFILSRIRKGKAKKTDLREIVLKIELTEPNQLEMILKSEPGKTVRPFEAVKAIFDLPEETLNQADMLKIVK